MDIPVPADTTPGSEETKIAVATSASTSTSTEKVEPVGIKNPPEKISSMSKEDEDRKKIAELISSKEYHLGIKEKRSSPLLTIGSVSKKSKKSKKKSPKKTENTENNTPAKKKQMAQVVIFVVLIVGFVAAIDAGYLDIGINLPFDLIKS